VLGVSYQVLGNHEEAISAFTTSIKLGADFPDFELSPYDLLADSFRTIGEYQKAISSYKQALEIDPNNALAWYGLGLCCAKQENYEKAAKCYEKVIQQKPDHIEAHAYLISVYEQLGKYDVALEYAVKAMELSPSDLLPMMCLNAWGYNLSNYRDGLENYLQANENALDDVVKGLLYYCLGETNSVKGNNKKAKDAYMKSCDIYKQLSKSKPDYYYAFWGLGSSYYGLKQYDEAIKAYNKAIKLHPKPLSSYVKLSFLYSTCPEAKFGNGKVAVELAIKACELTAYENDVCLSVLAAACAECGDFEKAVEYQKKAIELADDEAKAEYKKRLEAYKANKPWRQ